MPTPTTHRRICPFCEACCGLQVTMSGESVVGIRGDESDVFSRGFICPKGYALKDLHEDPDRLRHPLIRRGSDFVEATWEEAFEEIERRLPPILEQHGRDAVALAIGNPTVHKAGLLLYGQRFARTLGTRNVFSASTLDQMPKQLSAGLMFGHWLSIPVPDIERTHTLLIVGANPMVSNGSLWSVPDFRGKARELRQRGGKLLVVDPRRTETAAVADGHWFIRPGADVFLLLGMVHSLFEENLVRLGHLDAHVAGLENLREATAEFSAEAVAARCGIAAPEIRDLAGRLAAAPSAAVYGRIGTCTQSYGTLVSWLVDVLNVLIGRLDAPGGAMFPKGPAFVTNATGPSGTGKGIRVGRRRSRVSGAPEVYGELPMTCLSEEIEVGGEGQVRALFTLASNPVLSAPNGSRLSDALAQLELMVSIDIYRNETTRHAHVILPGLSPLEEAHFDVALSQFGYRNAARYSLPVLEPRADRPLEWEILLRLTAIADGRGAHADLSAYDDELTRADVVRVAGAGADGVLEAVSKRRGPDRLIDLGLRSGPYGDFFGMNPDGLSLDKLEATPGGVDLGPLTPRIPEVLRTPSGKIELAPPMLIDDLTRVRKDLARPAPEFVLIGRRELRSNNSWMHNLPTLAKGPARCTAKMHPEDAARLGLSAGAQARMTRGDRELVVLVELSEEMMRGVISLPHGYGHDAAGAQLSVARERPGVNMNHLLDESDRDPLSGNAVLSGIAVEMAPA